MSKDKPENDPSELDVQRGMALLAGFRSSSPLPERIASYKINPPMRGRVEWHGVCRDG